MKLPLEQILPSSIRGKFWFPNEPEFHFTGAFTIRSPHNYDLELDAPEPSPSQIACWRNLSGTRIPAVCGITEDGEKITFIDCGISQGGTRQSAPGPIAWLKLTMFANLVVIGESVSEDSDLRFSEFSAFFTGFNQWVGHMPDELFDNFVEPEKRIKRTDEIEDFGIIEITCFGGSEISYHNTNQRRMVNYWRPIFRPSRPYAIQEVTDTLIQFLRLLILMQGVPVGFDDIKCTPVGVPDPALSPETYRQITLLPSIIGFKESFEPAGHRAMLLSLDNAGDDWPRIASGWFKNYDKLAPVLDLYFEVVIAQKSFTKSKFLFIAQALEGYHRLQFLGSDNLFSGAVWKRRRDAVIDAAPASEREWLREELAYAPKVTLVKRLNEVIGPLSEHVQAFVDDVPRFCNDVKHLRNQLTHPDIRLSDESKVQLPSITDQLRTLLELALLRDLGASADTLNRVAKLHRYRP